MSVGCEACGKQAVIIPKTRIMANNKINRFRSFPIFARGYFTIQVLGTDNIDNIIGVYSLHDQW